MEREITDSLEGGSLGDGLNEWRGRVDFEDGNETGESENGMMINNSNIGRVLDLVRSLIDEDLCVKELGPNESYQYSRMVNMEITNRGDGDGEIVSTFHLSHGVTADEVRRVLSKNGWRK